MEETEGPNLSASALFNARGIVAVVTGGGTGIGRMVAKALADNEAKAVYIIGRRRDPLDETARYKPGVIIPVAGDVTSKDSLSSIADRVKKEQGYLNVLVANAGINGPAHFSLLPPGRKPSVAEFKKVMWKVSMDEFTDTFHVNSTAVFYTVLAFLELLDAANTKKVVPQKSQVIVMSSGAAFNRKVAAGFPYSMSKAAVHQLSLMLATYFLTFNIRVNSVAPGLYPSAITADRLPKDRPPWEDGAVSFDACPLKRSGKEEDMAGAILFLVSNAGAYVNGECLLTDGGRLSV